MRGGWRSLALGLTLFSTGVIANLLLPQNEFGYPISHPDSASIARLYGTYRLIVFLKSKERRIFLTKEVNQHSNPACFLSMLWKVNI